MTVKPGQEVTVTNDDTAAHTVTEAKSKSFDTGNVAAAGTGKFTAPDAAGAYPFICTYHPNMKGTLTVAS
jgi:plastocyanin